MKTSVLTLLNFVCCYLWLSCKISLNFADNNESIYKIMKSGNKIVNSGNLSEFEDSMTPIVNLINSSNSQIKQTVNSVFEKSFNKYINSNPTRKILMLGLFELTSKYGIRSDGASELLSAKMAVSHINNRKFLPYPLEIVWNDTKVLFFVKFINFYSFKLK